MNSNWNAQTARLFTGATRGEESALHGLLERYLPRLRAYVHMRIPGGLRPIESTEDIAQSVCRDLLGEAGRFEERSEAEFRAWLFTSALNKIRMKCRFHGRRRRDRAREVEIGATLADCLRTASTPSLHAIAREESERLRNAIESLPADYRDVVLMAYVVGMSRRAIGEELGRSEGAVRMLLGRAVARLGDVLEADADRGA